MYGFYWSRKSVWQSIWRDYVVKIRKEKSSSKIVIKGMYNEVIKSVKSSEGIANEFPITIDSHQVHIRFH